VQGEGNLLAAGTSRGADADSDQAGAADPLSERLLGTSLEAAGSALQSVLERERCLRVLRQKCGPRSTLTRPGAASCRAAAAGEPQLRKRMPERGRRACRVACRARGRLGKGRSCLKEPAQVLERAPQHIPVVPRSRAPLAARGMVARRRAGSQAVSRRADPPALRQGAEPVAGGGPAAPGAGRRRSGDGGRGRRRRGRRAGAAGAVRALRPAMRKGKKGGVAAMTTRPRWQGGRSGDALFSVPRPRGQRSARLRAPWPRAERGALTRRAARAGPHRRGWRCGERRRAARRSGWRRWQACGRRTRASWSGCRRSWARSSRPTCSGAARGPQQRVSTRQVRGCMHGQARSMVWPASERLTPLRWRAGGHAPPMRCQAVAHMALRQLQLRSAKSGSRAALAGIHA